MEVQQAGKGRRIMTTNNKGISKKGSGNGGQTLSSAMIEKGSITVKRFASVSEIFSYCGVESNPKKGAENGT